MLPLHLLVLGMLLGVPLALEAAAAPAEDDATALARPLPDIAPPPAADTINDADLDAPAPPPPPIDLDYRPGTAPLPTP